MPCRVESAGLFHLRVCEKNSSQPISTESPTTYWYIEGDGNAYLDMQTASPDPTPIRPTAYLLARQDFHPHVIYVGRPCQYEGRSIDEICTDDKWWTDGRFSEEVIESINKLITKVNSLNSQLNNKNQMTNSVDKEKSANYLTGFSGGGGVAALVAARRSDVVALRTVAGNLDTDVFSRIHGVTPMNQSMNPALVASRLNMIPQLHFVGAGDEIVPAAIAQSYIQSAGDRQCIRVIEIPHATHQEGWVEQWAALSKITPPACPPISPPAMPFSPAQ